MLGLDIRVVEGLRLRKRMRITEIVVRPRNVGPALVFDIYWICTAFCGAVVTVLGIVIVPAKPRNCAFSC